MRFCLVFVLVWPLLGAACMAKHKPTDAMSGDSLSSDLDPLKPQELAAPLPSPADEADVGYIVMLTAVRRQPTDAKEVVSLPAPHSGVGEQKSSVRSKIAKQANWLTQLNRGERVSILHEQGTWLQVRTSDEQEGWVRRDNLVIGKAVQPATVHEAVRLFGRPDLLALIPGRQIEAGALVFALRTKDQFTLINDQGRSTGWILTALLETGPDEVDVAKLLSRAAALEAKHDAAAAGLRQLAQAHYGHTRLVKRLLGPPPAQRDDEETAPSGPEDAQNRLFGPAGGSAGPGAGAIDEHGQWQETADPGVAAPGGFDSPASGPPQYEPQMQQEPQQGPVGGPAKEPP